MFGFLTRIKRIGLVYLFLGFCLVLNYFISTSAFLGLGFWLRSILLSLISVSPIFFAAIIFSHHFKSTKNAGMVYGVNLAGAVLGGFLEYSSMVIGLNKLYILMGGVLYAVSLVAHLRNSNNLSNT